MDQLLFCFCVVMTFSSIMAMISFNPIHSVMWLVVTFLLSASLLMTLEFDFLALLMIMIYVGAMAMLFLFVMMMLDMLQFKKTQPISHIFPLMFILGVITLVEVWWVFSCMFNMEHLETCYEWKFEYLTHMISFSFLIYTSFYFILVIMSLLLLMGMVGTILLTLELSQLTKKQELIHQHHSNNSWI